MSKEKDINNGFKIDDIVKHSKGIMQGRICGFEWSGIRRALIDTGASGYGVVSVEDLILVSRPEKEVKNEE